MLSHTDFLSPQELNDFASEYLGLNGDDCDLYYESYYNMDTEMNFYEEQYARGLDKIEICEQDVYVSNKPTKRLMKVLKEIYPYRFCESDDHTAGWIEKYNYITKRYSKMYECDSSRQLMTAMDDIDYVKWLDPEGVPCYRRGRGDSVKSPYSK